MMGELSLPRVCDGLCCCLPVLGTEEALVEPMLLALDTTLPLWVLSTKRPGKKKNRSQSLRSGEHCLAFSYLWAQWLQMLTSPHQLQSQPPRALHFMLQCSRPSVYTAQRTYFWLTKEHLDAVNMTSCHSFHHFPF